VSEAVLDPSAADAAPVNRWFIAAAVGMGALMEIIDTSIVNVALTDMQASLGTTLSQTSWIVSSYGIANVIVLPLSAWLGQRFGKKRYFLFSLAGFLVASILCGMSTSLPMLVVARVMQGLTGGGLLAKAQSILFETFPREEQAMAQAFFGAIVIAGPVVGPTLGGYIVTNVGWRWIFFINLPVGVVALSLVASALPADGPRPLRLPPVDWLAIGLLAIGLGAMQTFLEEGNSDGWFDSAFICALAVAAVLGLAAFVWRTLSSDAPVVDLRVLRYRSLAAGSVLSIVVGMALYGALFSVPIFAQSILGFTSQQTGMLLLPGALASAFTMPIAAKVNAKLGDPRITLTGGALVLTVSLLMLSQITIGTSRSGLDLPLVVRAFGTVFMFLPLSLATLGPIPKKDVAAATGFFNLTRQVGGAVGVALLTTMLDQRSVFHAQVLREKLVATAPAVIDRVELLTQAMLPSSGSLGEAHARALALLSGEVHRQAAVLSFADIFRATAVLVFFALPLVALLGKPAAGAKVDAGH
jgi:DHA2 family multidrug resistance protein